MKLIAIHTTVSSLDEARLMAKTLVEKQLVACAHIEPIESVYRWNGEVCQDSEYRVTLKTLATNYSAVETAIKRLHSYELPAIYALPITEVSADYADWVKANSQG